MVISSGADGSRAGRPRIVGMGLVALDVVMSDATGQEPRFFAGGTCGNVLTILSYLGWRSSLIARLCCGSTAECVVADLERFGVLTKCVSRKADGSTPVIIHRIRTSINGEAYHTFSWRCPSCGARLPGYRAVLGPVADEVAAELDRSNVFFFDRVSRGVLNVARALRKSGAVIVFEPASVGDPRLFREAWVLAHIVKYSHERLRDIADLEFAPGERNGVLLEIETLGRAGIRYRSRLACAGTRGWVTMAAFSQPGVRDAAGAGDWCTAGLLDRALRGGSRQLRRMSRRDLGEAVQYGQALAAWNCRFEGARGGMYEVSRSTVMKEVRDILVGEVLRAPVDPVERQGGRAVQRVCPACSGGGNGERAEVQRLEEA